MDIVKEPGPDHPITITAHAGRVRALYNGHIIADSDNVLVLKESSYKPVAYFPREDVEMAVLGRTDLDTYCPYKGHAAYYTIARDAAIAENAVWTYETPHPAMSAITGRLAFYPNVVEIEGLDDVVPAASPDAVIQHTDAGDGTSQREHWAANTTGPR